MTDSPTTLRYARTANGVDGAWRDATYANPITHYPRMRPGWLWSIAVAAGACLLLGLLGGCGKRETSELPANTVAVPCTIVSKTDSGQRRYCGKACFKVLFVYTYECPQRGTLIEE